MNKDVDKWMDVYQKVAGLLMIEIPNKDESLSERAQEQLKKANEGAVQVMNALANIIELCDNPNTTEDELL